MHRRCRYEEVLPQEPEHSDHHIQCERDPGQGVVAPGQVCEQDIEKAMDGADVIPPYHPAGLHPGGAKSEYIKGHDHAREEEGGNSHPTENSRVPIREPHEPHTDRHTSEQEHDHSRRFTERLHGKYVCFY